jgi:poly-gamma-glutamate synthesis protein (capsule biosynthesis protein)
VAYSLGNFISNQDRTYRADLFPVAGGDTRDGAALRLRFERRPGAEGRDRAQLAEATVEPLWTENVRGAALVQRQLRVVRVAAAEARVRAELDRLWDPVEGPRATPDGTLRKQAILEKQEYLRTLILRRKRVAEVVGEAFVGR